MEKSDLGAILSFFIILIIGLILIGVAANQIATTQQTKNVINQSVVVVTDTAVKLTNGAYGVIAVTTLWNTSQNTVSTSNYTTDLTLGTITVLGGMTNQRNGTYNITYSYYPEQYVKDTTSRTLLDVIIIFFSIGILAVGIYYLVKWFALLD